MITIKEYFMGRDIAYSSELTDQIKINAERLIKTVNLFLAEIGIAEVIVSSGWRPSSINSKVVNAAKKSLHISGLAVDLVDNGTLRTVIMKHLDKLEKYGLWLENPNYTSTWIHLDLGERSKRKTRIFNP